MELPHTDTGAYRHQYAKSGILSLPTLPGDAPHFEARRHPPELWGKLPRVFNTNATGASVFADHHAAAVEEIGHGGDRFATVAGAGSHDGDQFAEGVFGAVDFFVDIFHGSFCLLCLTAWMMPAFKKFQVPLQKLSLPTAEAHFSCLRG